MAEILLEGRDCEACGTEVRKGALFCYHCGESVAPDVAVTTDTKKDKVSDAWFQEDVTATVPKKDETIAEDAEIVEEIDESEIIEENAEIIEETDESEIVENNTETAGDEISEDKNTEEDAEIVEDEPIVVDKEKDAEETETEDKPKLKSAAAMRRKPKRIQKKRVEIVWDEPNSPPNVWFLIATILFAILAVGLWLVARYLG